LQRAGFEWLYRLVREPWRWRRQLALLKFIFFVLRSKSSAYSNKNSSNSLFML
jgi:UDP-N-acetyl-D-mannosaminuronic acid transferase (WecB/TagA/CpsF family)